MPPAAASWISFAPLSMSTRACSKRSQSVQTFSVAVVLTVDFPCVLVANASMVTVDADAARNASKAVKCLVLMPQILQLLKVHQLCF